ncbi:MAG: DUF1826 domain-containing protein [Pseudomonadota bacterium]
MTTDRPSFEAQSSLLIRQPSVGHQPGVLTDIYNETCNASIWRRDLEDALHHTVQKFMRDQPSFKLSMTVAPDTVVSRLNEQFGESNYSALSDNIGELVDMFACLFSLSKVGVRLAVLKTAMCPKFHVDKVPCRLITTYHGVATEWLPHHAVDRSKLGSYNQGRTGDESRVYQSSGDIQQLDCGDVALLKGESWLDNEGAGLVHRSPALSQSNTRLLLTLDFVD